MANWPLFNEALLEALQTTDPGLTVDDMEQRLVNVFHQAADKDIPYTKFPKQQYRDHWYFDKRVREYNHRINSAKKT
ncbi:hypothetical protein E2C01_063263 [Portunus trituberculatus]|uniref:Uncharacterized protein n=1 Tax=Portunus trituberculatus TaxID=210409 RepID=A0A5B7HA06_PORTR|nr:hypothetical protein [Portunus trituberculatus]